jgi:hypothetical protein
MYNDHYSIQELLAELAQVMGATVGTSQDDNTALLTHREVQLLISELNKRETKWTPA